MEKSTASKKQEEEWRAGVMKAFEANNSRTPKTSSRKAGDDPLMDNLHRADAGLADIYVKHYNGSVKIVDENGRGYIWNGQERLWKRAGSVECKHSIKNVLEPILNKLIKSLYEAKETEARNRQIEFIKKIVKRKVLSSGGLSGVFGFIIASIIDKTFDSRINVSNPDVLPIEHGQIIDLKTRAVRYRTFEDLFSFECPVTYLGDNHPCEHAERFFKQVFVGDQELIDYAKRLFGYSMTGHINEKSFYFLWGEGNNGKSTLMEMLGDILLSFYSPCDKEIFLKQEHSQRRNTASPSMIKLKGRRLCSCSETEDGKALDEPQVKMLTGGDTFTCRDLYKSEEQFKCVAKLMMLTNSAPIYNTMAPAMQSRIRLLPFLATFGRNPDPKNSKHFPIDEKFVSDLRSKNLSEVFTILVRGANRWYESGLACPKICQVELAKQNDGHDYLQQFIDQMCMIGGDDCREKKTDFHRSFKSWCERCKFAVIPMKEIVSRMENKGFKVIKNSVEFYTCISLDPSKK